MTITTARSSATTEEPTGKRFRGALRGLALIAAASLAFAGLGASAANATADPTFPAITNSALTVDCSNDALWDQTFSVPIALGTAVSITASNCLFDNPDAGVDTDTQYSAYSVPAGNNGDLNLALGDGDEDHELTIEMFRVDPIDDPAGVLSLTSPSTIPSSGFTSYDAAIATDNLTVEEGYPTYGYLGGNETCEIEIGSHPYATKTVTVGIDGSYTFRIVGTNPQSSDLTIQPGYVSPINDPFLAVYSAFDPAHPGAGIIGCNDDRDDFGSIAGVGLIAERFPQFTADLAPGTYTLVLSTWGEFTDEDFSTSGLDQSALYQMWGPEGGIVAEPVVTPPVTPAVALQLGFAVGTPIASATTTATALGLKPQSHWSMVLHSDPYTLGEGTVADNGVVSQRVSLPAGLASGVHSIVLTGVAPDDSVLTSTVWFTLSSTGIISDLSWTGPTGLAVTGAGDVLGGLSLALLAVLAGLTLVAVRRRRSAVA